MVDRNSTDQMYQFSYEELFKMAFTDELTGLPNYRKFKLNFKEQIHRSLHTNRRFAILFMDINNFKIVNDLYGHIYGDKLLEKCSSELANIAKRFKEAVYRKSGDEFLMLINDTTNIIQIKDEIERSFNRKIMVENTWVYCAISIGFSIYPIHGKTENELLDYADRIMYKNKNVMRSKSLEPEK